MRKQQKQMQKNKRKMALARIKAAAPVAVHKKRPIQEVPKILEVPKVSEEVIVVQSGKIKARYGIPLEMLKRMFNRADGKRLSIKSLRRGCFKEIPVYAVPEGRILFFDIRDIVENNDFLEKISRVTRRTFTETSRGPNGEIKTEEFQFGLHELLECLSKLPASKDVWWGPIANGNAVEGEEWVREIGIIKGSRLCNPDDYLIEVLPKRLR